MFFNVNVSQDQQKMLIQKHGWLRGQTPPVYLHVRSFFFFFKVTVHLGNVNTCSFYVRACICVFNKLMCCFPHPFSLFLSHMIENNEAAT